MHFKVMFIYSRHLNCNYSRQMACNVFVQKSLGLTVVLNRVMQYFVDAFDFKMQL